MADRWPKEAQDLSFEVGETFDDHLEVALDVEDPRLIPLIRLGKINRPCLTLDGISRSLRMLEDSFKSAS